MREFDKAIADLDAATVLIKGTPDVIEQDGAPNLKNIPRSTLQGNIWYHLALAHYLKADYDKSRIAWLEGLKVAKNDDTRVAKIDWLYMTYRRMGREADAKALLEPITEQMDIIENTAYHKRLLMYKGLVKPEDLLGGPVGGSTLAEGVQLATQGYGVGQLVSLQRRQGQGARGVREDAERRLVGRLRIHRGGSGYEARALSPREEDAARRQAPDYDDGRMSASLRVRLCAVAIVSTFHL